MPQLAPEDVVPLHLADLTFPEWHPLNGQVGEVFAFALRHPSGLILFETGIGRGNAFIDDLYQVVHRSIETELEAHGHQLGDVRLVVTRICTSITAATTWCFPVRPSSCKPPNTRRPGSLTTPF